ncbi:MAG: thioredoxin family protein [Acidobacteria bacterium]|nr:hypothetical protein [Pyrinomonadaceae bacterium]RIJ93531.1 MAG: thioredoxin family protein [Acidobacteriota bacterium]
MREYYERSMTFEEYLGLLDDLLRDGKTTGDDQSVEKVSFALLNRKRIERIQKTFIPETAAAKVISEVSNRRTWYILTEGWCGDAAQSIPVIEQLTSLNPLIETRYLLRDQNLELMDKYLTNGSRSIPKVISTLNVTDTVLWTWGPRPHGATELFADLKAKGTPKPEILEAVQRWYNADKGNSIAHELAELTALGTKQAARTISGLT